MKNIFLFLALALVFTSCKVESFSTKYKLVDSEKRVYYINEYSRIPNVFIAKGMECYIYTTPDGKKGTVYGKTKIYNQKGKRVN